MAFSRIALLHRGCGSAQAVAISVCRASGLNVCVLFRGSRAFSLEAGKLGTADPVDFGSPSPPETESVVHTIVETSSQAKWAADAATLSELPPQGDFTSLGLGGYSPIGLVQWTLEYVHLHAHLPWWAAIATTTVLVRLALFPLAARLQANSVKLNNIQPESEKLMAKTKEYEQLGNKILAAQQKAKLMVLYQKHQCNPLKAVILPLMQVPIFISFFIAIRKMATLPVESMKTGGLLWFKDLTVADPFYVLPVMACVSFLVTMEVSKRVLCVEW